MLRLPTVRYALAVALPVVLALSVAAVDLRPASAGSVRTVSVPAQPGGEPAAPTGDDDGSLPADELGTHNYARFGDGPLAAVLEATAIHAPLAACALTPNQLAALTLAPVWAETVSNELTVAPSPMTLSRYDHGSETLFVAGQPPPGAGPTPFWHPGVGLWQMDSAGLGRQWSADQRIDVRIAAHVVAPAIATLWCEAGFELVWADWFACVFFDCAATYAEIYDPVTDTLRNIDAAAISTTGGMEYRLCRFAGNQGVCGWVDPSRAQGNASFAVEGFGPSPITSPFYVFRSGTDEVRVWLAAHSGLANDIVARRALGTNARDSLISVVGAPDFCDVSTATGSGCVTTPPVATPTCDGRVATIIAVVGQATIGTNGADVIVGTEQDDIIDGGAGDDVICAGLGADTVMAGDGNDRIFGDGGDDRIWGQGGDDVLSGGDGEDRIRGGDGNDLVEGGLGADNLSGGRGNDFVAGGDGPDSAVRGGTGDDVVDGGPGADLLVSGNGGSDQVYGGLGDDALVTGGPRPDVVRGGTGNDVVKGLGGADLVYGDGGDDQLFGGRQRDTLDGGDGTDSCNGGSEIDATTTCESTISVP